MVDVSDKAATQRTARAEGFVAMAPEHAGAGGGGRGQEGRRARHRPHRRHHGRQEDARADPALPSPRHHQGDVDFSPRSDPPGIHVTAEVKVAGPTGVEMEALTAVSVACLTIYDMLKAADKAMSSAAFGSSRRRAAAPARIGRTTRASLECLESKRTRTVVIPGFMRDKLRDDIGVAACPRLSPSMKPSPASSRTSSRCRPRASPSRRRTGARWPSRWQRCSRSRRSMRPPWTAMPCARPMSRVCRPRLP